MARMRDLSGRRSPRSTNTTERPSIAAKSAFASSKKDRRQIKHSAFVSKIMKDHTKKPRRRRPSKKLVTTLESLADALPEVDDDTALGTTGSHVNIIRRRSVKTRPGAMKRKEKLEKGERERFTMNMAEMSRSAPVASAGQATESTSNRWQALRAFLSGTLERLPDAAVTEK